MRRKEVEQIAEVIRQRIPHTAYRMWPDGGDLAAGIATILAEEIERALQIGSGRGALLFSQGGNVYVLLPRSRKWECHYIGREGELHIIKTPLGFR